MTNGEYKNCISIAKSFLYLGGNSYKSITFDDLVSETLIYLSENGVPFSVDSFKANIVPTRSKMVKILLSQNPKERALQNKRSLRWRHENREKYNKKRRVVVRKKRDYSLIPKAKGIDHAKFKGILVTPLGRFESSYDAAKAFNVSSRCIQYRCKSNNFTDFYIDAINKALCK